MLRFLLSWPLALLGGIVFLNNGNLDVLLKDIQLALGFYAVVLTPIALVAAIVAAVLERTPAGLFGGPIVLLLGVVLFYLTVSTAAQAASAVRSLLPMVFGFTLLWLLTGIAFRRPARRWS